MLAGELRSDPDPMEQAGILRSWVDAISRAVAVDIARARRMKPAPAVTAPADAAPIQRIEITVPAGTTNEETKFTKSLISLESSSSQEFGASSAGANSKTAALQKKEQSLILYADDILENAMVVDLEHAVRNILSKHNVLSGGRVVIYARVAANAMIVEKIMKRADASIETIKVTGDVLQANGDEVKEAEALVRLARARGSKEVLGLIRGATGRPEDLAAFARNAGLPIIVAGPEKGIYSFAGALALAIEAKMNNGLVRGWLIVLPPVRNLSDDLKRRCQEYRNSLIALAAA
jgi:hypothetical protein